MIRNKRKKRNFRPQGRGISAGGWGEGGTLSEAKWRGNGMRSPPSLWRGTARSTQGIRSVEQLEQKSSCYHFHQGAWKLQSSVHNPPGKRDLPAVLSLLSSEE